MTESKPYQPPQSEVAPSDKNKTNKDIMYRAVPAFNGARWIIGGVKNFATSPFKWMLVVFVYLGIIGILSMIPGVSIVATIIGPILIAGLMLCAHNNKYKQTFYIKNLFDGFSLNGGKLAALGALNLGVVLLLLIVVAIAMLVIFIGSIENIETMFDPNNFTQQDGLLFLLLFLIVIGLMLPIVMAFWFAPALVVFHDINIFLAIKLSFMGCVKNMLPYLILSLMSIVFYIIAAIPFGLLFVIFGTTEPNASLIAIMVVLGIIEALLFTSIFLTSIFASYEDIFNIGEPETEITNAS